MVDRDFIGRTGRVVHSDGRNVLTPA